MHNRPELTVSPMGIVGRQSVGYLPLNCFWRYGGMEPRKIPGHIAFDHAGIVGIDFGCLNNALFCGRGKHHRNQTAQSNEVPSENAQGVICNEAYQCLDDQEGN